MRRWEKQAHSSVAEHPVNSREVAWFDSCCAYQENREPVIPFAENDFRSFASTVDGILGTCILSRRVFRVGMTPCKRKCQGDGEWHFVQSVSNLPNILDMYRAYP